MSTQVAAEHRLWLGTDRADITPSDPVPLAGFAARASCGPAATVSAPLRLRCLAFAYQGPAGGAGAGQERAVLVGADLLWWGDDLVDLIRQDLVEQYGLRPEQVLLHATHTHSGPQTSRRFTALLGEVQPSYLEQLRRAVVTSVGRALACMVPVTISRAVTRGSLAVDRRWARTAGTVGAGPIDDEVTVLRFARGPDRAPGPTSDHGAAAERHGATPLEAGSPDSDTVAVLVHYACHPVVHHANAVTSDFAGAAMDVLEARHPGAVALYAQGCCGDVNPARYRPDGSYRAGDQAEVDQMGQALAELVDRALAAGGTRLRPAPPAADGYTVELPVRPSPDVDELRGLTGRDDVVGQWARLLLENPERRGSRLSVRVSRLRVAEELTLLGMAAEPVSAYGLHVKAASGGGVLPMGYTNGMSGYLVTARQLRESGYEPAEAPYYFGMPGPFDDSAETAIYRALDEALAWTGTSDHASA